MLNFKKLFIAGVFFASGFTWRFVVAGEVDNAKVIEQAESELKTLVAGIPCSKIMDQCEAKIKSICCVPEQLELRNFGNKTILPLYNKLFASAKEALSTAILDLTKETPIQEVSINEKTALLINNLLRYSYFDKIKDRIVNFIFQYSSAQGCQYSKEAIDKRITVTINGFIQKNLRDVEMLNLISFLQKSKGLKKVVDNIEIFKQIIRENLSPAVAAKFQQFCA